MHEALKDRALIKQHYFVDRPRRIVVGGVLDFPREVRPIDPANIIYFSGVGIYLSRMKTDKDRTQFVFDDAVPFRAVAKIWKNEF